MLNEVDWTRVATDISSTLNSTADTWVENSPANRLQASSAFFDMAFPPMKCDAPPEAETAWSVSDGRSNGAVNFLAITVLVVGQIDCRERDNSAPHSRNSQSPTKTNVLICAA